MQRSVVAVQTSTFFDEVMSYAGMRKIALGKSTPTGPLRIFLNNEPLLFLGTLDQARTIFLMYSQLLASWLSTAACKYSGFTGHPTATAQCLA